MCIKWILFVTMYIVVKKKIMTFLKWTWFFDAVIQKYRTRTREWLASFVKLINFYVGQINKHLCVKQEYLISAAPALKNDEISNSPR